MALGLGSGMCSAAQCVLLWEDPTQHLGGQRRSSGRSLGRWQLSPGDFCLPPPLQHCSFSCLALGMSCGLSNPCLLLYSQTTVNIAQLRHPRYQ